MFQLIHVSGVDVLRSCLPNLKQIHTLEQCGHTTHFEKAREVAQFVRDFHEGAIVEDKKGV